MSAFANCFFFCIYAKKKNKLNARIANLLFEDSWKCSKLYWSVERGKIDFYLRKIVINLFRVWEKILLGEVKLFLGLGKYQLLKLL